MPHPEYTKAETAAARKEAIEMAKDYGVDAYTAGCLFDLLGPSELHDGFVCALEDMEPSFY